MKSHPATRQDEWVLSKMNRPGRFVDIGAWDGVTHSNTYQLERRGWYGIMVEPLEAQFQQIVYHRQHPLNQHHCCAIKPEDGLPNNFFVGGQYSGLVAYMSRKWYEEHLRRNNRIIEVPCKTLQEVLANSSGQFDYLSIDTEGSELAILRDWFSQPRDITFGLITVEFRYDQELFDSLQLLLESNGYLLDEVRGFDLCFMLS